MREWKIKGEHLQDINDASKENMEKLFDAMYPGVENNEFMQDWCKDSIMYECLGARTGMTNASSRADQAERALTKANDDRVDTVTEIGQHQDYDRICTYRGWSDFADYWTNKYDTWTTRFKSIYGETFEEALEIKNKNKSSPSVVRKVTKEENKELALKIKGAELHQLTDEQVDDYLSGDGPGKPVYF